VRRRRRPAADDLDHVDDLDDDLDEHDDHRGADDVDDERADDYDDADDVRGCPWDTGQSSSFAALCHSSSRRRMRPFRASTWSASGSRL